MPIYSFDLASKRIGTREGNGVVSEVEPPPDALDLFVSVSSSGVLGDGQHIMTSPDGVTWTIRNSITTYDGAYRDVTWAPEIGVLAAVGLNNDLFSSTPGLTAQIITSTDALTWTRRNAPATSNWWSCVEWSADLGRFVSLSIGTDTFGSGTSERVMYSSDGTTWTAAEAPAISWRDLAWSPSLGLFVAVANSLTDRAMSSPDGITWTQRTPSADNNWAAVCWSPTVARFVAVASSGTDRVMYSDNGTTWTAASAAEANGWIDVIWCSGLDLFVACATSGTSRIMTSPDGITWTGRTASVANAWSALAFNGTTIVCVAQSGTSDRVMTSTDGINWTTRTSAADKSWVGLCWAGNIA